MAQFTLFNRCAVVLLIAMAGCVGPASISPQPKIQSGLQKGDDIIPWNPIHVAGPNAGTDACPVCTYEARPAVIIFMKNGQSLPALADRLQSLVNRDSEQQLKGFIVVTDVTVQALKTQVQPLGITQIGICSLDPQTREHDLKEYKINPAADNTVMIYKDYKVRVNFADLDAKDFARVETAVAQLK